MTEEVKNKNIEETPKVEKVNDISPFVNEKDTFQCKVGYFLKEDGSGFCVERVHDEFDPEKEEGSFEVTFRVPTQRDANIISQRIGSTSSNESEMGMFNTFSKLEYVRLLVLMSDWTLVKPCTEESVEALHPSFVKGIISALRDKISMDGIV